MNRAASAANPTQNQTSTTMTNPTENDTASLLADDPAQLWLILALRPAHGPLTAPEPLPAAPTPAPTPRRDYKLAGCVVLAGAILFGSKPNEELLPKLLLCLEGARTLDRLAAASLPPAQLELSFQ